MQFFTRHSATEAQRSLVRERFGDDLIQVDAQLPEASAEMRKLFEELGIGQGEPVAMVAPIHIVEIARDLMHPVIVFTTAQRGQLVREEAEVRMVELFGYSICYSDDVVRVRGQKVQVGTLCEVKAEYWYACAPAIA